MSTDNKALDEFIDDEEIQNEEACDCNTEECRIKSRKGDLVERISKKLIVEDGRELLI
jgi:hypothetical protein